MLLWGLSVGAKKYFRAENFVSKDFFLTLRGEIANSFEHQPKIQNPGKEVD